MLGLSTYLTPRISKCDQCESQKSSLRRLMMEWFNILRARLRGLFRRECVLRDIEEELRVHVEMETETNIRRGMPPDEARAAALKSFGALGRNTELGYDIRGGGWLETLWQDLRYGARMLVKQPGFTLVAVLTLALGIGANTAIFSLLDALLLKTLPVRQPEQLVFVEGLGFAYPDPVFPEFSEKNSSFAGMFSFHSTEMTVVDGNQAERVIGELVSGNFFNVLGLGAHLGRVFSDADDQTPGGHFVAVISYNYWRRRFGADPQIIGREIR